ncbi:MAG: hypothetical protein FWC95_03475 [Defluviitaleaceae bacterium]|nr:hypothetical protein [Defluviitaleaceae bacterium]
MEWLNTTGVQITIIVISCVVGFYALLYWGFDFLRCLNSRIKLFLWLAKMSVTGKIRVSCNPIKAFWAGVRGQSSDLFVYHNGTLYLIKLIMFYRKTCEVYAHPHMWVYNIRVGGLQSRVASGQLGAPVTSWNTVREKKIRFNLRNEKEGLAGSSALKNIEIKTMLMFSPAPEGFYISAEHSSFNKVSRVEAIKLSFGHTFLTEMLTSPRHFAKMLINNTPEQRENVIKIDRERWQEIKNAARSR